jgi:integrase
MQARVQEFLVHQRDLGYVWRTESFMLRSFGKYADQIAPGAPVTVELAVAWARAPMRSRIYHAKRLDAVRTFAKYEASRDFKTEVPPTGLFGPSYSRVQPYIYSNADLQALLAAARLRSPALRSATLVLVVGVLASTGMRIGELLALNDDDVDLRHALVRIRRSKAVFERVIPVSRSTLARIAEYQSGRSAYRTASTTPALVRGSDGGRLRYAAFRWHFLSLIQEAGIGSCQLSDHHRPTIHGLRHTFACKHLLRAYREKRDIHGAMHDLSVYLGHASLASTYWYLSGIPQLLKHGVRLLEASRERTTQGEHQ